MDIDDKWEPHEDFKFLTIKLAFMLLFSCINELMVFAFLPKSVNAIFFSYKVLSALFFHIKPNNTFFISFCEMKSIQIAFDRTVFILFNLFLTFLFSVQYAINQNPSFSETALSFMYLKWPFQLCKDWKS